MKSVEILSLGHYVPERILTNQDLEKMVDTTDEWITTRTGIKERRIAADDEKTSDMAIKAAEEALARAKFDPQNIDLIVVATTTADSSFPAMACLVQKSLNAKKAAAFDVGAACSGFLYALTTAKQFLLSGMYQNALVIAADKMSKVMDWNDRTTCVLFGDGAAACLIQTSDKPNEGILSDYIFGLGEYSNYMQIIAEEIKPLEQKNMLVRSPYVVMQGPELFKVAVNSMAEGVEIAAKKAGISLADISLVIPHQANDRIISAVAKKLGTPREKVYVNIEKYGNMSAASVAIALYEAVESGAVKKGDYIALVVFGAGLVSAANIIKW
ncbi:MAG: ketoacyl-ACP synthase III [Candidatus Omnitrophica bacterium]|nr:ketoacyl-ACP synthase III [Candidatus Omnitrophota bacterium]